MKNRASDHFKNCCDYLKEKKLKNTVDEARLDFFFSLEKGPQASVGRVGRRVGLALSVAPSVEQASSAIFCSCMST